MLFVLLQTARDAESRENVYGVALCNMLRKALR